MTAFILPLDDPAATDPEQVGPKAANLASLAQVGLPTPGGFALTAQAYRQQLRHLGIADLLRAYNEADLARAARGRRAGGGALLGADRGPQGREFRGPVRELSRADRRKRILDRGARL